MVLIEQQKQYDPIWDKWFLFLNKKDKTSSMLLLMRDDGKNRGRYSARMLMSTAPTKPFQEEEQ